MLWGTIYPVIIIEVKGRLLCVVLSSASPLSPGPNRYFSWVNSHERNQVGRCNLSTLPNGPIGVSYPRPGLEHIGLTSISVGHIKNEDLKYVQWDLNLTTPGVIIRTGSRTCNGNDKEWNTVVV